MFIELVESLRCLVPHEDTWLVASIDQLDGRHVARGSLGCPVCRARYTIANGILDMTEGVVQRAAVPHGDDVYARMHVVDEESVTRAAALLGVTDGGQRYVLCGAAAKVAIGVSALVDATVILLSPADDVELLPRMSVVRAGERVPLAAGSVHGVLVDASLATAGFLGAASRALAPGGRLVAPVGAPLPEGVRELARDEREWVAVRETAASAPVALRRR